MDCEQCERYRAILRQCHSILDQAGPAHPEPRPLSARLNELIQHANEQEHAILAAINEVCNTFPDISRGGESPLYQKIRAVVEKYKEALSHEDDRELDC